MKKRTVWKSKQGIPVVCVEVEAPSLNLQSACCGIMFTLAPVARARALSVRGGKANILCQFYPAEFREVCEWRGPAVPGKGYSNNLPGY